MKSRRLRLKPYKIIYAAISTSDKARLELGSVMYAPNMLGSRGPRKMQVCIPVVSETGEIIRPKNAGVSDSYT
jgi:hypothetical protein